MCMKSIMEFKLLSLRKKLSIKLLLESLIYWLVVKVSVLQSFRTFKKSPHLFFLLRTFNP